MKKLVVVFLLLLPLLIFADPNAKPLSIGLKAPDGTNPGDVINVRIDYNSVEITSLDGPAYSTSNTDKVLIYFYSSSTPGAHDYLGYQGVSISNWSYTGVGDGQNCTFNFTVPTYSGAVSFQIMSGLWWMGEFDPIVGSRRTSFMDQGSYIVAENDPPSGWDKFLPYDEDGPTPVELSTFTAIYEGVPKLQWTTQSESNNQGWNIYRGESEDAVLEQNWIVINPSSLIEGAGTSAEERNYVYADQFDVDVNTTYFYLLESQDFSGVTQLYGPIPLTIPDTNDNPIPPDTKINILRNSPNPFYRETNIQFEMTATGTSCVGELSIYNIRGEKVRTVFNGEISNGLKEAYWDGKDKSGQNVQAGIYFYKLKTNLGSYAKKLILLQ